MFSACVSLADTTVKIGPPPPTPKIQTPVTIRQTSLPPLHAGKHRWVSLTKNPMLIPLALVIVCVFRHLMAKVLNDLSTCEIILFPCDMRQHGVNGTRAVVYSTSGPVSNVSVLCHI